jgi:hypothetical protein
MPRPISSHAIVAAVVTAMLVAGCGRSGRTTTTTTTSTPNVQADARLETVHVNVGPMLTHIARYRAGVRHSYLRPAREPGQQVTVQIAALGSSVDIDPVTGPSGFRVIGTLENRDARYTELAYGLKPGTRYLIWVDPGPMNSTNNSRTRWGLLEYPRTSQGVFPSQPIGYVLWCQNYDQPAGRVADVDLRDPATCNVNVAQGSDGTATNAQLAAWSPVTALTSASEPDLPLQMARGVVWFQCATGGCFASNRF